MRRTGMLSLLAAAAWIALCPPLMAWDCAGHRTITYLALDGLPQGMPAWLKEAGVRDMIASQSCEPDRWRGTRFLPLAHVSNPDHYLDVEDLEQFGLTLESLPPFRNDFVQAMAVAKALHPENLLPYDAAKDKDGTKQWPGFVPYAIVEHYGKLRAAFNTLRILESLNDPARRPQLEMARAQVMSEMGILSHFVGDTAQPLHTTRHHHGWVGDNPKGYTRDYGFHAYIDGEIVRIHGLTNESLKAPANNLIHYGITIGEDQIWGYILAYLRRSFDQVEVLYILERDGTLEGEAGKVLITERLSDAATVLESLFQSAWEQSTPSDSDAANFVKYDKWSPAGQ